MSGANASPTRSASAIARSLKKGRSRQEMTCRIAFLVVVCSVSVSSISLGQENRGGDEIRVLPVRNNVHMLVSAAGNTTVQIGEDGVVVVDTLTAPLANFLLFAIQTLSSKPIRLIITTSFTPDHIGGNAVLAAAGRKMDRSAGASIRAHQEVLQRMSALNGDNALPLDFWPTDVYTGNQWDTFANGESILLLHEPAAHTDGDTIVFFRRSDVISTGDVFSPDRYPKVDVEKGGSINGIVAALNHILKLAVPEVNQEGGTMIIPGHGHLCDEADVAEYRDMVTIVRDRVQDLVKKGMSLEQVKAARLTRDYDPVYGTPQYTGEMFVEAVYRSLVK
jgi:glyoxylase-like metal-dependent hydrolase (beta-lactamase superfamily II)